LDNQPWVGQVLRRSAAVPGGSKGGK
jgi:hypothetical protein